MQKSENLYFSANIEWFEERTRTTTVSYGGISTKFKICKGVYLRGGSIAPMRNTEEYLKLIDNIKYKSIHKIKIATDDYKKAYDKLINSIPVLKEENIEYRG